MTPRAGEHALSGAQRPRPSRPTPPPEMAGARREVLRLARRVADLQRERVGLERFAAVASHEVMMPLVMIEVVCASVLQRDGDRLDGKSREELDLVSRTAAETRLEVEALLHFARCAERAPAREPVDLHAIVQHTTQVLRAELELRAASVTVKPLPVVRGDEALVTVVVKNLLANALHHGPPRGARIRVFASRLHDGWRVSVAGTGRPLAIADVERIFAPFERGPHEHSASGVGLGLAICREIVERHGGTLGAQPQRAGNRFHFTLPD
jgi:signal transduction histidine kinase